MGSSDDEVSDAEDEAPFLFGGVTPLPADHTPYKDMRCPDCGSTNAVARDFQCHVRAKGVTGRAGNSLVDDRIRAMIALMHQHFVSQVQMQPLAEGIAKLLGRTLHQFPKRSTAQVILKETGVGAKAELCAQLLEWMDECGPQMMSVCLDAASIGEDKYEGISFCRKVVAEPFNPRRPHVYRRLALGLVDLVNGTDDHKFAKVLELMSDCIKCYNAIHEPEEPMTLTDMALMVGFTCNDHQETVVPNRFVPWVVKMMTSRFGTSAHHHEVNCLAFKIQKLGRAPGGVRASDQNERQQITTHLQNACFYSAEWLRAKLSAGKVQGNQYNCGTHRNALGETGMLAGMARFERAQPNPQAGTAQTGKRAGGTLIQNATYTAGKKYGKGKEHETLTRTKALAVCRDFADKSKLYFERILGARGAGAVTGNALGTYMLMMDGGDWGMRDMLDKEDARNKGKANQMHDALRAHAESDLLMVELRIAGILNITVFRVIQTYAQSHATQGQMVPVIQAYSELIEKLLVAGHPKDWDFWLDAVEPGNRTTLDCVATQLLTIAADPVVLHENTQRRRVHGLTQLVFAADIPEDRRQAQDALMAEALHYAAKGMQEALTRVTSKKYAHYKIWSMSPDDPKFADLNEAIGTSDPIERYFGFASWLRHMNRNQTPVNRDFVLAIHETRFGTRLVDAIMDRPEETARRCGLMRAYSPEFELEQKERKKMDKKMKALAYIADLSKQAANIYRDAETFRALEAIATSHVHVPFQTFDDFVVFCKYSGTAKQVQDQVHDRLRDALYMFRDVHGMDTVPLLVDIFGPPRARRILSSGGVSFSNRNLFHKVQRCGAYLEQRGSPKGFYGWPYLAAAAPRDDAVCMLAGGFGCRRTVLPPSWRPGAGLTIVDHAEENIMSSYPEVEVELVESEPESESEDDMGRDDGNETDPGYYSRSSGDSGDSDSDPGDGDAVEMRGETRAERTVMGYGF